MNKVICDICGTAYPETAAQCPICGSARRVDNKTVSDSAQSENTSVPRTYVRGGRFSNANVRKRNRANQSTEKPVKNLEGKSSKKKENSNRGLVITAVALLVAIVLVVIFIVVRFIMPMNLEKNPQNSTKKPQSSTSGNTTALLTTTLPKDADTACTDLTIRDSEITLDAVGRAWLLEVTPIPKDTTDVITYTSSDEKVATVTEQGRVTAVGNGEAIITITCGQITKQCRVVCEFPVETSTATTVPENSEETQPSGTGETLALDREDITFSKKGETFRFSAGDLSNAQITWSSDDPSIASVENGKVTAVAPGMTTIRAEYDGQKASCIVRCSFEDEGGTSDATEATDSGGSSAVVSISSSDVTISVDESFELYLRDASGNALDVTWSVDDSSVCAVSGNTVTGLASGTATVSTTYEGETYSCIVRVG